MEEETRMRDVPGNREATDPPATEGTDLPGALRPEGGRRGPSWRGWVLSILVAIALSVTATLILGGSATIWTERSGGTGTAGSGCGGSCCPPADTGK